MRAQPGQGPTVSSVVADRPVDEGGGEVHARLRLRSRLRAPGACVSAATGEASGRAGRRPR